MNVHASVGAVVLCLALVSFCTAARGVARGAADQPAGIAFVSGGQASPLIQGVPEEPPEYDRREVKAFYDWRNDLFFRHFDMAGMGRTDFMTARRTYRVWLNEFGTPRVSCGQNIHAAALW